jgi:hypothetical protein
MIHQQSQSRKQISEYLPQRRKGRKEIESYFSDLGLFGALAGEYPNPRRFMGKEICANRENSQQWQCEVRIN